MECNLFICTTFFSDCQKHEAGDRSHERVCRSQRVERGVEAGEGERLGVRE